MKYVWTIFVNQNSRLIVMVISISPDVGTLVANQNFFIRAGGQPFSEHTAGEARTYN
jgi:hypothetical protein